MSTPGVLAIFKTTPDRTERVAEFFRAAREGILAETGTVTWYSWQADETTFGVFDSFVDEEARQAHFNGAVAAKLGEVGGDLFEGEPDIKLIDILAIK